MKDKLEYLKYILAIIVFVGLIAWASIIDPILEKAKEIGVISSIVRYVVLAVIVLFAVTAIGAVEHDNRVQDPYKSILCFGILGLVGLIGWYFRSQYGW